MPMVIPLRVVLSEEARCRLMASIPDGSRAHARIREAVELPGSGTVPSAWMVTCDLQAALTLLTAAERQCPDAIRPIMDAVHRGLAGGPMLASLGPRG
jgi:hypothetical protein